MRDAVDGTRRSLDILNERVAWLIGETRAQATRCGAMAAPSPTQRPAAASDVNKAGRAERDRENPVFKDAEALIEEALERGTWRQQDIDRFRTLMRSAPEVDWVAEMVKIDAAINAGKLHPDPELMAFH